MASADANLILEFGSRDRALIEEVLDESWRRKVSNGFWFGLGFACAMPFAGMLLSIGLYIGWCVTGFINDWLYP